RDLRFGPRAASWPGRREHRLDADVCDDAARLHLLPGNGAAALVAAGRLDAAADLCVRGHAGPAHGTCLSRRPDGVCGRHQCGAHDRVILRVSDAPQERPAARFVDPGRRINTGKTPGFPPCSLLISAGTPIYRLTLYFAFCTILQRKRDMRAKCRLASLAARRLGWSKAVRH